VDQSHLLLPNGHRPLFRIGTILLFQTWQVRRAVVDLRGTDAKGHPRRINGGRAVSAPHPIAPVLGHGGWRGGITLRTAVAMAWARG
jgi:hypothetical protein